MNPAQSQLYWREWNAAARANGWNSQAGIAAALDARRAGHIWQSPELDETMSAIWTAAEQIADEHRSITATTLRHACSVVALGRNVSSKRFTNADLDKVLALLRLLANPANLRNLTAFQDSDAGERRRHVHVITSAEAPYWQSIARDKFGRADLDRLTLEQLRQLSMTIRSRLRAHTNSEALATVEEVQ